MSIPSEICTRCRSGTAFRGWRHPLDQPHRWTPLFFLDDAVALAAGHRPCALCRRDAYRTYRDALTTTLDRDKPVRAFEINARLNVERLRRGRGLDRGVNRRLWTANSDDLPDGCIVVGESGEAGLVRGECSLQLAGAVLGWGVDPSASAVSSEPPSPEATTAIRSQLRPMLVGMTWPGCRWSRER